MESPAHSILVVEDEIMLRLSIVEQFEAAGWHVLQTSTAEEALTLLAQHKPDLVFTDIQLAGHLSGWDVGSVCSQEGVAVVYTSGAATPSIQQQAEGRFFTKPYEPTAVVAACERWRSSDVSPDLESDQRQKLPPG
jgi:CheY-like chemotaxis protein